MSARMSSIGAGMKGEKIAASDICRYIPDGANVFLQQGPSEPQLLRRALCDAGTASRFRLLAVPVAGINNCEFAQDSYSFGTPPLAFIGAPKLADGIQAGRVGYVPGHWSQIVPTILRRFPPEVAVVQVSPPDAEGYCNLGVSASIEFDLLNAAGLIIAEVNRHVPRVAGDTRIHTDRIAFYAESEYDLLTSRPLAPGAVELEIARNVSRVVAAGSTLQVGIGSIPDAVVKELASASKIAAFHSGILTDAMMDAADTWREPDRLTAGMILGSKALYSRVNDAAGISLRGFRHTHSPAVLASIERFVAVNSAIEVDLLGQVNAEALNGRQVGGIGGQADFFRGARGSAHGAAIVALPSTANGKSRIVAQLDARAPVTTARVDVDYVVTEWGVAEIRDQTIGERARALSSVAAPQFRNQLLSSASTLGH